MKEGWWTEEALRAVSGAQNQARLDGDSQVCAEHMLLGVLGQDDPRVRRLLGHFAITPEQLRRDIEGQIVRSDAPPVDGDLPLSPRVRRVMELADDEAAASGGTLVRPAHVLLGLMGEGKGLAARVLSHLGARQTGETRGMADEPVG